MGRIQRVRRGEQFSTEEKLNQIIDVLNAAFEMKAGGGIEMKRSRTGIIIAAPSSRMQELRSYPPIISATEPSAATWMQGQLWIDTNDIVGNKRAVWIKTDDNASSNVSKMRLPGIHFSDSEPAAVDWAQGELWVDTDDAAGGATFRQMWFKTKDSNSSNASKIAVAKLT